MSYVVVQVAQKSDWLFKDQYLLDALIDLDSVLSHQAWTSEPETWVPHQFDTHDEADYIATRIRPFGSCEVREGA